MKAIGAVCLRTWRKTWRRPVTLTFSFLQPAMWLLFFGFLFQRFDPGEGVSYRDFLVPGIGAMTVLFGASQSGIGLLRDLQTGFWQRMVATPAGPFQVLAGKLLADVLRLVLQAWLLLGLGALLGLRLRLLPGLFAAALVLGLFALTMSGLSCAIAARTRNQESMATFVHLVNMPLLFTSSALAPARQMPDWLAGVAQFNPLTRAVDVCRAALLHGDTSLVPGALLPLGLWAGAASLLAWSQVRKTT